MHDEHGVEGSWGCGGGPGARNVAGITGHQHRQHCIAYIVSGFRGAILSGAMGRHCVSRRIDAVRGDRRPVGRPTWQEANVAVGAGVILRRFSRLWHCVIAAVARGGAGATRHWCRIYRHVEHGAGSAVEQRRKRGSGTRVAGGNVRAGDCVRAKPRRAFAVHYRLAWHFPLSRPNCHSRIYAGCPDLAG